MTAAASITALVVLAPPTRWIPAVAAPVTAPVALTETAAWPLAETLIPTLPPDTLAAVTVIAPPESAVLA